MGFSAEFLKRGLHCLKTWFCCFVLTAGVIGSVISSTVLQQPAGNMTSEDDIKAYCGMNDCPGNNYTSSNWEVSDKTVSNLVEHLNALNK